MKISIDLLKGISFLAFLYLFMGMESGVNAQDYLKEDSLLISLRDTKSVQQKKDIYLKLVTHTRKYDLKKSIEYCNQGIELSNDNDDLLSAATFKLEAALTNYYLGNYDNSLELYLIALKEFELQNNFVGKLRTLTNIGAIYDRIQDYNKAVEYYQLAIQYYNNASEKLKSENIRYITQIYNNLASAYDILKKTQLAIEYYEKALKLAKEIDFDHIIGSIYNNLGKIETAKGNYKLSRYYLDEAISIRKNRNENEGLAKSYYFLSNHYSKTKQIDSAEWAAQQTLDLALKYNLLESQKIAYQFLFEIYEEQGNTEKALKAHILYKSISDSLLNEQKLSQLSQLQTNYEIEELESKNLIEKTQIKNKYTLWVIVLSSIASIAILLVYILRLEKKKVDVENSKLELDIETKNKELTTNVMYLVQKNEFINTIAKSLIDIQDNVKDDNRKSIQRIIYNLQSQSDNEIWKEFEFRFNQVHNDFYEQLRTKHPDITPSEERLSALLRLNMTTKEIASITHQSIRGIEVARGRLRKKLNLTGIDTNLQAYLSNF